MTENRSVTSPLRIDTVHVPGTGGLIGLTECPGKNEYPGMGIPVSPWKRDLELDLQVILDWRTQILVGLLEDYEFELLGVTELPARAAGRGIRWLQLPVPAGGFPDERFEEKWLTAGKELRRVLTEGGRIVLHGNGGSGRAGMVAARLLVELGMDPCPAFALVRQARSAALLTEEQEDYVRSCRGKARD
ncbi:MAG TPA: hypothetical protein VMJ66_03425 [Geobacteraceae bacterium]|nr:hypothetical protein [Geobacteraceae bacterium]